MTAIEIARKLSALGEIKSAVQAYTLVVHENEGKEPALDMEAAAYILQNGGDYKISYTCFRDLYNNGHFRDEILPLMTAVFYDPNEKTLRTRYERNCKLLSKYPYIFKTDFLDFDELPIRFFPFDEHNGYIPFYTDSMLFGDFVNFRKPVVSHNFFKNLDKPVLADNVFSQYELEYLNDNVRKSEYIGRENHIYLHYQDWATFCAYLQCLNMRPLLESKKFVFLIGDEIAQYPIDFKERFGIDYSIHPVKAVGIREVNRLIWHTQLSAHNGGDFFNEIFDIHPNLLMISSLMFDNVQKTMEDIEKTLSKAGSVREAVRQMPEWEPRIIEELYLLWDRNEKDTLVAYFLNQAQIYEQKHTPYLDKASRIAPVLFFQPHFSNMIYQLHVDKHGRTMLSSEQYESVRTSPLFRNFKYIKTFTPMRRLTTSHGGTLKFMNAQLQEALKAEGKNKKNVVIPDVVSQRVLNRSFMIDWQDRLYTDSILVRFEDGKLNPKATFTALAAFLDLPYTETMTYCSLDGEIDPLEFEANVRGFDSSSVYRTYDEFANDAERTYIEYFLRDAYEHYGYDFQYYDGAPMDEARINELVENFTTINSQMSLAWRNAFKTSEIKVNDASTETMVLDKMVQQQIENTNKNRIKNANVLMRGLYFINKNGQPLHMMPKLELDPALLEQPLYH